VNVVSLYRILYVDDEPELLETGRLFLERAGQFIVDTNCSASACLPLLSSGNYDAVISDYQMPEMNGIEFLERVRSSGNTIPFILFTGRGREEVAIQALNAGADFYLQKGGDPRAQYAELAHQIRQAVQRRRAEQGLRERETQLRVTLGSTADGILAVDNDGKVLLTNPRFAEIWRIPPELVEQTEDQAILDFVIGQVTDPGAFLARVAALYRSDAAEMDTLVLRDGRVIERYSSPMIMDGTRIGRLWSFHDITTRKRVEEELRESRERFGTIFNAAQVGIILVDAASHTILQANPKALELVGATEGEVTGAVCHRFICPADRGACPVTDLGQSVNASERQLMRRDGRQVPIIKTVVPAQIGGRRVLVESFFEITGLKRAEKALRESEEKYRRLADNAPDMVYRMSLPDGIYRYVSPAALQITGYAPEDFYDNPLLIRKLLTPEWREYFRKEWEGLVRGEMSPTYEFQITDRAGKTRWLNQRNVLIRDEKGKPVAIEGIVTDITAGKLVEEALQQANRKLKLLSGITRHDINNQLTIMQGYLDLVERKQPGEPGSSEFRKVSEAAQRIRAMIQFTHEYEEIGVNAPVWHDCRQLVETAARQVHLGNVAVKNEIPEGTEVLADPLIVKVCYNLMDNAVRYGGKITTIRFAVEETGAGHTVVCEDDGGGIPAEEKDRIFLRGYGKNTGMGLFLAREILSITGITIRETGEPGQGARFEISVPDGVSRTNPAAGHAIAS